METELLKQFVLQIYPLQPQELEAFTSNWQPLSVKRKTILTAAGEANGIYGSSERGGNKCLKISNRLNLMLSRR